MTNSRKIGISAIVLGAIAAAWLAFSPYLALSSMRDALVANDAERLNAYIDYEALRADIKTQFATSLVTELGRGRPADPKAVEQAMRFAGPMVDQFVNPNMVTAMLAGRSARMSGRNGQAPSLDDGNVSVKRVSLTTFTVSPEGSSGGFRFAMRGMGWKLVGIDVPQR